jgi:hypothetical protein
MAGGSVGLALALNDESLWQFRATLLAALELEKVDAFELAQQWNQGIDEAGKVAGVRRRHASLMLRLLIGLLQDALRIVHGVSPLVADRAEAARLHKLAERIGTERLLAWIGRAEEADLQIDRNVSLELTVEAFADAIAR